MKFFDKYTNDCDKFTDTEWYVLWALNILPERAIYLEDDYIGEFFRKKGEKEYTVKIKTGEYHYKVKNKRAAQKLIEECALKCGYQRIPKKLKILL